MREIIPVLYYCAKILKFGVSTLPVNISSGTGHISRVSRATLDGEDRSCLILPNCTNTDA